MFHGRALALVHAVVEVGAGGALTGERGGEHADAVPTLVDAGGEARVAERGADRLAALEVPLEDLTVRMYHLALALPHPILPLPVVQRARAAEQVPAVAVRLIGAPLAVVLVARAARRPVLAAAVVAARGPLPLVHVAARELEAALARALVVGPTTAVGVAWLGLGVGSVGREG